jgi:hypothetical protein
MAVATKPAPKEAFRMDFEQSLSRLENALLEARSKMNSSELDEADRKVNELYENLHTKP